MKYTPLYQIPYLEGSDKLSMLAAASEEQATGIEAALSSSDVPPAGSDLLALVQRMNALEDSLADAQPQQVSLTDIATFPPSTTVNESVAFFNSEFVWFTFSAEITPGSVGLLMSFKADYTPPLRFVIPIIAGSSAASATIYANGNIHAQYPLQNQRQNYRASGYFQRSR